MSGGSGAHHGYHLDWSARCRGGSVATSSKGVPQLRSGNAAGKAQTCASAPRRPPVRSRGAQPSWHSVLSPPDRAPSSAEDRRRRSPAPATQPWKSGSLSMGRSTGKTSIQTQNAGQLRGHRPTHVLAKGWITSPSPKKARRSPDPQDLSECALIGASGHWRCNQLSHNKVIMQ